MIWTVIWLAGATVLAWPAAVALLRMKASSFGSLPIDDVDRGFAILIGSAGALLWPLALLPLASWLLWRRALPAPTKETTR